MVPRRHFLSVGLLFSVLSVSSVLMYFKDEPLYPFGFGLSYTSFTYSNLRLSASQLKKSASITASVDITNAASRPGDEVVQLYAQHENSKQERPQKELKGFRRITLKPGETTTVKFDLAAKSFASWNESQHRFEVETDTIKLLMGSSSADLKLNKEIPVVD